MELIIFSDSLSSLQALVSTEIKNSVVKETHDLLLYGRQEKCKTT